MKTLTQNNMAKKKTVKKLWYVSFKHDEMEGETIYHVRASTQTRAIKIATEEFIDNNEIYSDDREIFDGDIENGELNIICFEVKESEILK